MMPNASMSAITWPKSHVVPHFDHLDIRNTMVVLTMLLMSHSVNASANGITCPEESCPTFHLS